MSVRIEASFGDQAGAPGSHAHHRAGSMLVGGTDPLAGDGVSAGLTFSVNQAQPPEWIGGAVTATAAAGAQSFASVGALEGGGHVVVWTNGFSSGGSGTVIARRFDANGVAVGAEIAVGSVRYTGHTATVGLDDGGFLIVWQELDALVAQRYSAAGATVGAKVFVGPGGMVNDGPAITELEGGGFVVSYMRQLGGSANVWTQALDETGALSGPPVRINAGSTTSVEADISALPDGGYLAAWAGSNGIFVRAFDADGTPRTGDVVVVSHTQVAGSYQRQPSLAVLEDGTAVVVWQKLASPSYSVMAQLIDAEGQPLSEPMLVQNTGGTIPRPMVHALEDGGYAVTFTNASGTTVQRYDASGAAVGDPITTTGSLAGYNAVALNDAGELVIVSTTGGADPNITFRRVEVPSALETSEDLAIALSMTMTQVDPTEPGQVRIVGLPEGGAFSAGERQQDGSWLIDRDDLPGLTLTPPSDFNGVLSLQATAFTDGDLANGVTRSFGISFAAVNDAPRTTTDVVEALEDQVITFSPLANDIEVEGEAMTITHINGQPVTAGQTVTLSGVGALKLNADGTLTFTPAAHWSGEQAFTYTVRDPGGASSQGSGLLRLEAVTDGATFSYGQLADWTPAALDATDVRVNAYTTGTQSQSSVAALADGGYLITWVSAGQDGSGTGVYAQRYDRLGQKVGAEHRVNELTAGDQQNTAVLAMEAGGWLIAWKGPITGQANTGIYVRRYDADGQASPTQLVTDAAYDQTYGGAFNHGAPTLGALPDGGFVVGWTTFFSASDTDIWLRHYGADGTPLQARVVEADEGLEDHLSQVVRPDGVVITIFQDVDGFYNGPTSGRDTDYGIYIEHHGPNGALDAPLQLNTSIAGNQTHPTLAILADGRMVAAWQSADASGTGIVFRMLDSEGTPIGSERWANRTTAGNQTSPDIVALADGTFLILWTSAGTDGSGAGVYGQRISADGTQYLGAQFRLNATTTGDQLNDSAITETSFAVLDDGTLVATWWGDGEVHHRRFDPPEAAFTAYQGDEIAIPLTVNLVDASETFELAISNLPPGATLSAGTQREDGAWVLTAAEAASLTLTPPAGYAGEILLRIEITTIDGDSRATAVSYREVQVLPVDNDADGADVGFRTGADPTTEEDVNVTEVSGGLYEDAGVAALTGGGHVVVWSGQFGDSDGWGVRAKVYGADGSVVSVNEFWGDPGDFTVNTFKTGAQQNPTVLGLGDGGFAVFWHSFNQDGSEVGVYGQRFNATGLKVGGEFRVNTTTALAQEAPTATLLDDGGFVVLFESEPVNNAGFEIRGQRYDAAGVAVGGEFLVRDMTGGSQRWPDVTALEGGGFVAVWNSFATDGSGMGLEMRVFDARNDATVYRVNEATLGSQTDVKIATLADGSFIAVWTTAADQPGAVNSIQARRFEIGEDGTLVGHDEFSVFGAGAGSIAHPDLVGLPDGGYIVLAQWEQPGDESVDIYAQRYDADGRRVGAGFRINETSYGDQLSISLYADPMVTVDANGDLIVVWTDLNDGNIYRRTFDIDPAPPFVGEAGLPISLAIEVEARDAAETIEIVLSNLPDGAVLSAGIQQPDGSWLLGPDDLDGLTLIAPSGASGTAFDLVVTVTTRQGADSFTTVAYQRVEVLPAPPGVTLTGTGEADALSGHRGGDTLAGLAGDDVLEGLEGDDLLDGGLGADTLNGGAGQDTAVFAGLRSAYTIRQNADGTFIVTGPDGTDTLTDVEFAQFSDQTERLIGETRTGTAAADVLEGTAWGDILTGLNGDDILRGGAGADVLTGGAGVDTADYSTASSGMRAQLNTGVASNDGDGGADTLSGIENLIGSAFNDLLIGDANVNVLRGGLGTDVLIGLAGNDVLWGGAGATNQLQGGVGDDLYVLEANDTVVEFAGEGTDTVEARIDAYVLGNHIENLTFTGAGAFTGTGNSSNNVITGGAGDDVLRGRGGADVLVGGGGIDTVDYSGAAAGMRAQLNTNASTNDGDGGTDTFSGVENLTGSAFNDILIGDGVGNVLRGGLGSDTLIGLGGNDVLWGGSGAANVLQGGTGDDLYVLEAYDSITEFAAEGTDTVDARINTYVLANNVENLIFGGTGDFAGTGNAANNVITGGAGADVLRGRGGTDALNGGLGIDTADYTLAAAGVVVRLDLQRATNDGDGATDAFSSIENAIGSNFNDVMFGDGGNNLIQGGNGSDVLLGMGGDDILMGGSGGVNNQLQGGAGNDWYILDAFDTCVEFTGEGIDTVEARIGTYTLGNHIENLLYTGPGKFVGNGNALNNQITGGALNDILRGGGGDDVIDGGLGNDELQLRGTKAQYTVTAEGDGWRIVDSVGGRDGSTYVESIELLRFSGNTTTKLTYAAAAPGEIDPQAKDHHAQVSPLAEDGDDFDPLVLPTTADGAAVKGWDDIQVLPGEADKDSDAFVLPATPDGDPLILPGMEAPKGGDEPLVLPGAEETPRPFSGLEARLALSGDQMLTLGSDGRLIDEPAYRDIDWMS
ncbi:Ig-like domain-containing protein [Roseibacterium beibuensis]|uniref:Ig-like domain-containing protein n=1 Tax=[Roseibacterium] beibuensis TaxID=1193142 RepID=UPI00217DCD43|nr:Ig-like domain-containing protein [Roseibacterium beibuensis]MCS6622547.1 Ig-like domain-containing protein [Roseibacterium beibuensis]